MRSEILRIYFETLHIFDSECLPSRFFRAFGGLKGGWLLSLKFFQICTLYTNEQIISNFSTYWAALIHSHFSQQNVDYIHIFTNNEKDWIFWYYHQKIYPLEFSQMSVLSLSLYSRSIFQKLILKFEKFRKSCKNTKFFFRKNEILTLHSKKWIPYFLQTFFRLFATFCTFSEKISIIRNEIRAKSTNPTQNRRFWVGFRRVLNRI